MAKAGATGGAGASHKGFRITGTFLMGDSWVPYKIEVVAGDEKAARERTLSLIGSRHRTKRQQIRIDQVIGVDATSAERPAVRQQLAKGGAPGRRFVS